MSLNTKSKFILGAAATGAYIGDIDDDLLGGLLGTMILGSTAALTNLKTSDVIANSKTPKALVINQNKINNLRKSGKTEEQERVFNELKSRVRSLKKKEEKLQQLIAKRDAYAATLGNAKTKVQLRKLAKKDRAIAYLQAQDNVIPNIAKGLASFGVNINPTYEGLLAHVEGVKDVRHASRILSLLDNAVIYSRSELSQSLVNQSLGRQAKFSLNDKNSQQKLSNYFQKTLLNSPEVADRKAQLLMERATGADIMIKNHNAIFTDSLSGRTVSLPLTAQTKGGVLYHSPNVGTYYAVSGSNPFAEAKLRNIPVNMLGVNGVPTTDDLLLRLHPELVALELYQGKDISKGLDYVKSQMKYGGNEAATELQRVGNITDENITKRFLATGTSINYEYYLNIDGSGVIDPETPLKKLSKISSEAGSTSQLKAVMSSVSRDLLEVDPQLASNIYTSQSVNNLTSISSIGVDPLNPLNLNERGALSVGLRDTVTSNRTNAFNRLMNLFGQENFLQQYESSNVLSKVDIRNKKQFNELATRLFGNEYSLGDGSGFFNKAYSKVFEANANNKIVIPKQNTGHVLLNNKHLSDVIDKFNGLKTAGSALTSNGLDQEFLDNYSKVRAVDKFLEITSKTSKINNNLGVNIDSTFEEKVIAFDNAKGNTNAQNTFDILQKLKKPITFKPNQLIGYDAEGKQIKLHSQYSSADLTGMLLGEDGDLILHTNAKFNPNSEDILKLFSEASKSNLRGTTNYQRLATLGLLSNTGQLKLNNGDIQYQGKSLNEKQLLDFIDNINNSVIQKINNNETLNTMESLIHRGLTSNVLLAAEDVKTDVLSDMLMNIDNLSKSQNAATVIPNYLKDSKFFTDKTVEAIKNLGGEDANRLRNATLLQLMTGNQKAGTDISATVANKVFQRLENTLLNGRVDSSVNNFLKSKGFDGSGSELLNQLRSDYVNSLKLSNIVGDSGLSHQQNLMNYLDLLDNNDFKELAYGVNNTIASFNKGQSILGIGNNARMSWAAYNQLLKSGIERQELLNFGNPDFKSLVELESLFSERRSFNESIDNFTINKYLGDNSLDVENILRRNIPEARLNALADLGIDVNKNSPFISYKLNNPYKDLTHLNFATITTDRSGFYDDGEKELLKKLEATKIQLFSLDQAIYHSANKSERVNSKEAFEAVAKEYLKLSEKVLRGDNSLLKNSLSLQSKQSNIGLVRSIGGSAEKFLEDSFNKKGKISSGVFISEDGLKLRMKRMGLTEKDLIRTSIEGTTLEKIQYRAKNGDILDFKGLITREPAQGPLSTTYENYYVDKSLKSGGDAAHIYIPENHTGYVIGKYGDYDQDTLQELFGKLHSKAEQEALDKKFANISSSVEEIISLSNILKVKGSNKTIQTPNDFSNIEDAVYFRNISGQKGRERKVGAAPSTVLSTNLNEALNLEYGAEDARSAKARYLAHAVVENLIKSAHLDTKTFEQQTETDIEQINRLRSEYLKHGNSKKYREAIQPLFERALNASNFEENSELNEDQKKLLKSSLNDLLDAEVNQAKKVSSIARTPLDATQGVGRGSNMLERAMDVMSNLGDTENSFDLHGTKSYGRMVHEISVNIAETFKSNKGLFAVGGAALLTSGMLSRTTPTGSSELTDRNINQSGFLRPHRNIENGIATNTQNTNYVTPKKHTNIQVDGSFTSLLTQEQSANNINQALFGDGIRSARLEL